MPFVASQRDAEAAMSKRDLVDLRLAAVERQKSARRGP